MRRWLILLCAHSQGISPGTGHRRWRQREEKQKDRDRETWRQNRDREKETQRQKHRGCLQDLPPSASDHSSPSTSSPSQVLLLQAVFSDSHPQLAMKPSWSLLVSALLLILLAFSLA